MQSFARCLTTLLGTMVCTFATVLSGCGTPPKPGPEQLASLGVSEGMMYWDAEQKLMQAGYSCYVSGAKREHFDCTKSTGFLVTCVHRVRFEADDKNLVSNLRAVGPACIGTP